jgi:uroporphyrinogen decarboxylase
MNDLLLRALRSEPVERPPVWFFRQAGRYLPEYHEVRNQSDFLGLCRDPDRAAEVTLQPLRRFRFDASIVFNDILVPPAAMGMDLEFVKGHGPRFNSPLRTRADVDALKAPSIEADMPHVLDTIRVLMGQLEVPLFGFAGAPFTLATYMCEGGGSKNFVHIKSMMWNDPGAFEKLMDLNARVVGEYLQAQVEAGCSAVALFDTWAGVLEREDFERWAIPYARKALEYVKGAPRLYFCRDASPFLDLLHLTGADGFGLDWRVDLHRARQILGEAPVMGNLDPVALHAPTDEIRKRVRRIIADAGPLGHIFNLGHGMLPTTPLEGVEAAVDEIHRWSWSAPPDEA